MTCTLASPVANTPRSEDPYTPKSAEELFNIAVLPGALARRAEGNYKTYPSMGSKQFNFGDRDPRQVFETDMEDHCDETTCYDFTYKSGYKDGRSVVLRDVEVHYVIASYSGKQAGDFLTNGLSLFFDAIGSNKTVTYKAGGVFGADGPTVKYTSFHGYHMMRLRRSVKDTGAEAGLMFVEFRNPQVDNGCGGLVTDQSVSAVQTALGALGRGGGYASFFFGAIQALTCMAS
ncbi:hypothetical protein LTR37_007658 [Vermiconidia calcicola]|uniref:Uncharacterized protein n=1 Tax=Vermiconidia calcicola TaxID=1690605 RepID=A0ACC3NEC9_9PEZI|nr:hypothetical protein LTR37_007658 [Vermiconidia calcicola]